MANSDSDSNSDFVYLASPIDLSRASAELLNVITESLGGVVVFNPASAWKVPNEVLPKPVIQSFNMQALLHSAAVVGVFTGGPSLGVPSEIALAIANGIPVVLFVNKELLNRSWYLSWMLDQDNPIGVFSYRPNPDVGASKERRERYIIEPVSGFPVLHNEVNPEDLRPYFMDIVDGV